MIPDLLGQMLAPGRWPAFVLAYTYAAAYVVALFVHFVAGAFGVA